MNKLIPVKLSIFILCFFISGQISGQPVKDKKPTIFDIPHKTLYEKWMWIHRSVVFEIIKERKIAYDSTYIKSYSKRLTVIVPVSARLMHFNLLSPGTGNRLQFTPNYRYDVGFGISSRWATFITNTGIVFFNTDNNQRGVTRHNDFQLNLYGKRTTSDISYQNYRGFYIANTRDFTKDDSKLFIVRPDVKATLFATSTYYIFNSKKFSYRNSFAFTESQLKSAGSVLAGAYYSLFGVRADSSLVSQELKPNFDSLSNIIEGSTQSFGITGGYIYTFVRHKAYLTTSIVPGVGLEQTTYDRENKKNYRNAYQPAGKVNFRLGFGYDTGTFFIGALGVYDYFYNFNGTHQTFNYSTGKALAFVGYRFKYLRTEKRILRKLKLIDYPGDPRNS
ncbi:MAG: Outer rane insertion signal [Bacteroidota bacterium]|jgi:hypothetical protein|nr:Outer rane insertion signal [Bacteroidota bacterium]